MGHYTSHAVTRAKERYGLTLTGVDVDHLLGECRLNRALLCEKKNLRDCGAFRLIWAAKLHDTTVIFVTDQFLDCVVTFLPADHFKAGNGKKFGRWRKRSKRPFPEGLSQRKYSV